jgi:hypothetical protein
MAGFPKLSPTLADERERQREAEAAIAEEIDARRALGPAPISPSLLADREETKAAEADMSDRSLREGPPDLKKRPAKRAAAPRPAARAGTTGVPDGNVDVVLKWADTPAKAKQAMEAESARKGGPRKSLIAKLATRAAG